MGTYHGVGVAAADEAVLGDGLVVHVVAEEDRTGAAGVAWDT